MPCCASRWKCRRIGNLNILCKIGNEVYTAGPHWPGVVVTIGVIFGGTYLNLQILKNSNFTQMANILSKLMIGALCCTTTVSLLFTALSDPGIVQNNRIPGDEEAANMNYCEHCDNYRVRSSGLKFPFYNLN